MLAFIIILVCIAYIFQKISMANVLKNISYNCTFSKLLVEPGETFSIISTITNSSPRFLSFLKLEEIFPKEVKINNTTATVVPGVRNTVTHIFTTYMMPRSKLERHVTACFSQRGRYLFNGADITTGDFLGIEDKTQHFYTFGELVVFPAPADTSMEATLGGFFGDISVRRFIMEDPTLSIGARGYTGREPLKQISWSHSARMGTLMVKEFDYTVEPLATIVLDINIEDTDLIEKCYCVARSVCQLLEEKATPYDFISNATTGGALARWHYKSSGLGKAHLFSILEGLGRASHHSTETFSHTLEKLRKLSGGVYSHRSTLVILPTKDEEKHSQALTARQYLGGTMHFIYVDEVAL